MYFCIDLMSIKIDLRSTILALDQLRLNQYDTDIRIFDCKMLNIKQLINKAVIYQAILY